MKNFQISFAVLTGILLSGCASSGVDYIQVDSFEFKGNKFPTMTSADHLRGDYSNLAEGEAVVVAISADNSGAVSYPEYPVSVTVNEAVAKNSERSLEEKRSRCDIDSDGIWDRYCPELISELNESDSENFVMFETISTVSQVTSGRDDWLTATTFDRNDVVDQAQPIYLRMLTVNRGNKAFSGDLDLIVKIPRQVKFTQVKDLYKVKSQAGTKAVVGGIISALSIVSGSPYAYLNSDGPSWIKDYNRQESYTDFSTQNVGGKLEITANDVVIEPNEGVELIYEVSYQLPDQ